jgi:hypothetical protein
MFLWRPLPLAVPLRESEAKLSSKIAMLFCAAALRLFFFFLAASNLLGIAWSPDAAVYALISAAGFCVAALTSNSTYWGKKMLIFFLAIGPHILLTMRSNYFELWGEVVRFGLLVMPLLVWIFITHKISKLCPVNLDSASQPVKPSSPPS